MLKYKDITPIVVSWNRADRLKKCLESLDNCPKIIVWDNDSKTEEKNKMINMEKDFKNVKFIYHNENSGTVTGWNRGTILSDTDWVLLTTDDMFFDLDWLSIANKVLDERPHIEQLHLNSFNAMLVHKKTFVRMGWWDEGYSIYPSAEDDDWYLRATAILGCSPYVGIPKHIEWRTTDEFKKWFEEKYISRQEECFNRPDNFMYWCNSHFSPYPVVGEKTITGMSDSDSGNTDELYQERKNQGIKTGWDYHGEKWAIINRERINEVSEDILPYIYSSKDSRLYARVIKKEGDNVTFDNIDKYYPGKDGMYLEETAKYLKKYGDPNMESIKPISFIQPSRNNLKYLKWSYNSIRKNLGYIHEICMADDFSDDGTWEWLQEIAKKDKNVKIHRNEGPTRLGHTILYDTLINDYATNDIVMIYHADMYALPGLDKEISKHIKPGVVVSATRIEPPLHPDGPEKILADYGIEPEEFDEQKLLRDVDKMKDKGKTTEGIFAPWAIYKSDFQSIGGHDPLYAPQSKEDSDIFNRFLLNGYKFVQTWEGFVYHMTCRGSRFADGAKRNPNGEVFMKNRETDEWLVQNQRSTRNFIRKWGHYVKHDSLLKPIVSPKYDIGIIVYNCSYAHLKEIEPWCSTIYIKPSPGAQAIGDKEYPKKETTELSHRQFAAQQMLDKYLNEEQKNTDFDLSKRVKIDTGDNYQNDILIKINAATLSPEDGNYLSNISEILSNQELEPGIFDLGNLEITIDKIKTYEEDLIVCES